MKGGERHTTVAKNLGLSEQTLHNWIKASEKGTLKGEVTAAISKEQMEISRLRSDLSRVKMRRDILKKSGGVLCERVAMKYALSSDIGRNGPFLYSVPFLASASMAIGDTCNGRERSMLHQSSVGACPTWRRWRTSGRSMTKCGAPTAGHECSANCERVALEPGRSGSVR